MPQRESMNETQNVRNGLSNVLDTTGYSDSLINDLINTGKTQNEKDAIELYLKMRKYFHGPDLLEYFWDHRRKEITESESVVIPGNTYLAGVLRMNLDFPKEIDPETRDVRIHRLLWLVFCKSLCESLQSFKLYNLGSSKSYNEMMKITNGQGSEEDKEKGRKEALKSTFFRGNEAACKLIDAGFNVIPSGFLGYTCPNE